MPPHPDDSTTSNAEPSLQEIAQAAGKYPAEALDFVQRGLLFTVNQVHGRQPVPGQSRHVSGRQLCAGLRDFAQKRWGLLARIVLQRWGVTTTLDFGVIVFCLVEARVLKTTSEDTMDDFRDVYDFSVFDNGYRIGAAS